MGDPYICHCHPPSTELSLLLHFGRETAMPKKKIGVFAKFFFNTRGPIRREAIVRLLSDKPITLCT